jgi:ATP-dependent DNA helicase RecG
MLPFKPTAAQKRVLKEIADDMADPHPMNRLLQGDVGSGKTLVAAEAAIIAVENRCQVAVLAPTEILASQHHFYFKNLFQKLGYVVALLTGSQSQREKAQLKKLLSEGLVHVAVGTHALLEEDVGFKRLGLAIVDEQHRFGVMQRAALREKGWRPDVLVMTATPIPRTLSMTLYGDLDVSIIDEMPAGRQPITAAWRPGSARKQIYDFVRKEVSNGSQAYIVFPLVEETEKSDLAAATESYEKMRATIFRDIPIALLHGRMKTVDKEAVMAAFKAGETKILVATTVIEVGVDVPNATIMVIEHAERFGLTQLHQLRGRVGRGEKKSYCILIADPAPKENGDDLGVETLKRLETMVATSDGFRIAEVDLELRGPGEFFGTRQHGLPELQVADIVKDSKILFAARDEAFALVRQDALLKKDENAAMREHLLKQYKDRLEFVHIG